MSDVKGFNVLLLGEFVPLLDSDNEWKKEEELSVSLMAGIEKIQSIGWEWNKSSRRMKKEWSSGRGVASIKSAHFQQQVPDRLECDNQHTCTVLYWAIEEDSVIICAKS